MSGFQDTGEKMDEGQFLQTVYPRGNAFGGPGRFALDTASHMDETHPLATPENAARLFEQWSPHLDLSRRWLVEKSPPNIVRTRFLQALFPGSRFLVILRHPLAVAYATRKWSHTSIRSLLEHTLAAYERFDADRPQLDHCRTIRYENFVRNPQETLDDLFRWLELPTMGTGNREIRTEINEKYFAAWERERRRPHNRLLWRWQKELEPRLNRFGYSLLEPERLLPFS